MKQELADIPVVLNLLDRNLQAETGIMDIEMLHGFLCGVIVSPVPLPPSRWLPRVLTQPAPDQRQAEAEIAAVMRLYNAVTERLSLVVDPDAKPPLRLYVRRLNPDGTLIESPASRLDPDDPDDTTPADSASGTDAIFKIGELWAKGFLDAIDLADQDWIDASQSWELYDEVLHLLTLLLPKSVDSEAEPVEAGAGDSNEVAEGHEDDPTDADTTPAAARNDTDTLTESIDIAPFDDDDDGFDEELPDPDAPLTTLERAMALGEMSQALHEIYLANRRRTKGSQTFRRESPKVGRNDPCPCGSGRKYKRCHGAN